MRWFQASHASRSASLRFLGAFGRGPDRTPIDLLTRFGTHGDKMRQDGRPCRVGYALDPVEAVKRLARTSPVEIVVDDVMWVPDRGIATSIAQSVLASIASHRRVGGWHDLAGDSVVSAVHRETFMLFPGAATVPHNQMISKWCRRR
jgi:hypothetical protein